MSGPKGGAYRVETAEQREARMLREAKAKYVSAESAWQDVLSRRRVLLAVTGSAPACERPAAPSATADSAAYSAAARALQKATTEAAGEIAAAREAAAQQVHADRVAQMVESVRSEQRSRQAATVTPAPDRTRIDERIDRRVRELAHLEHDSEQARQLVDDIRASGSPSRVDLLLNELDVIIKDGRAAEARRAAVSAARARLLAMRSRLGELTGTDVAGLRIRIEQLIRGEVPTVPDDLVTAVDAAVRHADEEDDRRHVARVMHETLEELGYVVGPEFSTDLCGATAAYARRGSSHYGVKLRLEPGAHRFSAQAVRSDAVLTSAGEDAAAERAFCDALGKLVELAGRDGVDLRVDVRTEPGAYALQQVSDVRLARPAAARSARREQERRAT
ncbi:hypothetical protein [Mycolicibacterium sp. F2034L]|uniref:hypothetical protein n=1 Tax=Mycolicibacterium sp. F2034L TaxID=2926422 RepID=UPI001FF45AED|nr:hypothetical protein [Mycolicibacterium sp. F2034L]MCK0177622.1 hypothetical protein [Mycolicibacterium sp. F2034L]